MMGRLTIAVGQPVLIVTDSTVPRRRTITSALPWTHSANRHSVRRRQLVHEELLDLADSDRRRRPEV